MNPLWVTVMLMQNGGVLIIASHSWRSRWNQDRHWRTWIQTSWKLKSRDGLKPLWPMLARWAAILEARVADHGRCEDDEIEDFSVAYCSMQMKRAQARRERRIAWACYSAMCIFSHSFLSGFIQCKIYCFWLINVYILGDRPFNKLLLSTRIKTVGIILVWKDRVWLKSRTTLSEREMNWEKLFGFTRMKRREPLSDTTIQLRK